MKIKLFQPLFQVVGCAATAYIVYQTLFYLLGFSQKEILFKYSVTYIFIVLTSLSLLIISLLLLVKNKNFDSFGYAFMALTCLKIGIVLFWIQPILNSAVEKSKFEKVNFLIIFSLFLAIETIVAIRLIQNKK